MDITELPEPVLMILGMGDTMFASVPPHIILPALLQVQTHLEQIISSLRKSMQPEIVVRLNDEQQREADALVDQAEQWSDDSSADTPEPASNS